MTDLEQTPAIPTNMGEVNITLSYIRRDISEIKNTLGDMKADNVSRLDFNEHLKADEDHEVRIRTLESFKETLVGKMWGIGIIAGLIMSILSLIISHYWK